MQQEYAPGGPVQATAGIRNAATMQRENESSGAPRRGDKGGVNEAQTVTHGQFQ